MTDKNKITLYKAENLLLIHWQAQQPFSGENLKFLLNDKNLPQPFLALQIENPLELMVIIDARQVKLSAVKNHTVIQLAENNQIIGQSKQARILIFSKKELATYSQVVQARFFTRLLVHVQEKFQDFPVKSIIGLIKRYALSVKEVYQLNNELFLVRLPRQLSGDNLRVLQLTLVSQQVFSESKKTIALYCDGALHFFVSVKTLNKQLGILNYGPLANIPVLFGRPQKITRQALLEKLQLKSKAAQALQGFILPDTKKIAPTPVQTKKAATPHDFKGKIQGLKQQSLIGWAQNQMDLSQTVAVDVYEGEHKLTTILADQDCQAIGLEPSLGRCAFILPLEDKWLQGKPRQLELKYANTRQTIPGSPVKLGDGRFDFKLTVRQGETVKVHCQQRTLSNAAYAIRLLLDGKPFSFTQHNGGQAFELLEDLPDCAFDGKEHLIQLNIVNTNNQLLYAVLRKIQHQYQGALEQVNYYSIQGWIANTAYPERPALIDIIINEQQFGSIECTQPRLDVQEKYKFTHDKVGFVIALPKSILVEPYIKVSLYFKGTDVLVMPRQTIVTAKDMMINSLVQVARYLKSVPQTQHNSANRDANIWACSQIIEPTIYALRKETGIPSQLQLSLATQVSQVKINKAPEIDVIIPVYQGYDETVQCIQSVLQASNNTKIQLLVINDCSPDGRLKYKLQAMAQAHHFTLLENQENLGFVATVNKGMQCHIDRDVILLNSDTLVANGWVDRLVAASQKNQNIATVTPFSNNATICSFPCFNQDNDFSENTPLEALNDLFYQQNKGHIIDLPTAVGFCMLIKREALQEIGYFDAQTWQKGYGEENDFCLRASATGWRHVIACDVFVQHHGSVSFADTKQEAITRNLAILNQRYPDYAMTVQRFIQQDPLAGSRNKVIKTLLKQQSSYYTLFVMHSLGGGSKAHGDHLASLLEAQNEPVLELSVINKNTWQLQSLSCSYRMIYYYPDDYPQLLEDLSELGIRHLHFHQTLGFPKKIWQLAEQLHVAYYFTAHDFLPICPRINLIDETGRYCNASQFDVQKCQRCVALNGTDHTETEQHLHAFKGSVKNWRTYYATVLQQAEKVICPSKSTAELYQQHFSLSNIQVKPHPEESFTITSPAPVDGNTISIAMIGAIGDHKGYQLLLDCAKNALKEDLPLHFVIIGYTRDDQPFTALDNVTLTGAYQNAEQLTEFLQQYPCQLAAFLSVWPETFCYTLTEALRNHLYPVTLNYGAIAERLQALQYGEIIAEYLTAPEINQALIEVGQSLSNQKDMSVHYSGTAYNNLLKHYYECDER